MDYAIGSPSYCLVINIYKMVLLYGVLSPGSYASAIPRNVVRVWFQLPPFPPVRDGEWQVTW